MEKGSITVVMMALWCWAITSPAIAQTATPEDIRNWVESLAHPSFKEREKAERNLWNAGRLAEKPVADATRHELPEIRMRSARINSRFELGIFPDTPPELRKQIEAYRSRPNTTILSSLISEGQILTVLRLIRATNGIHASILTSSSSIPKIEDYLINANEEKREQFYGLLGDFPKMARYYALFHGFRGTARKELDGLHADDKWEKRYYLLRAVGETEKAKKLASENGNSELVSQVDIVTGDLDVLLQQRSAEYRPGNIHHHCYQLALAVFQADQEKIDEENQKVLDLVNKDQKLAPHASEVFATTGQSDLAYQVLQSSKLRETRSDFLLTQGKLLPALELAGVDISRPLQESLEKLNPDSASDRRHLIIIGNIVSRNDCTEPRRYIYGKLLDYAKRQNNSRLMDELASDIGFMRQRDIMADFILASIRQHNKGLSEIYGELANDDASQAMITRLLAPTTTSDIESQSDYLARLLSDREFKLKQLNSIGESEDLPAEVMVDLAFQFLNLGNVSKAGELGEAAEAKGATKSKLVTLFRGLHRWQDVARLTDGERGDSRYFNHAIERASTLKLAKEETKRNEFVKTIVPLAPLTDYNISQFLQLEDPGHLEVAFRLADPRQYSFSRMFSARYKLAMDEKQYRDAATSLNFNRHIVLKPTMSYTNSAYYIRNAAQYLWLQSLAELQDGNNEKALKFLRESHRVMPNNSLLGEKVYPKFDKKGYHREVTELYEISRDSLLKRLEYLPDSCQLRNELAWMCSLVNRDIDLALKLSSESVEMRPESAAYIDTLANVYFAKGDRAKAIELSQRALGLMPFDEELLGQMEKFKNDPIPKDPASYVKPD